MASSTKEKTNSSAKHKFIQHLLCLSHSKDFDCALKEWTLIGYKAYDTLEALCICQHKIKYAFFAYNKKTGKTITVGSDCKNKFNICFQSEEGNLFLKFVGQWITKNGYENIEDIEEYARKVKESLYKLCFDKYLVGKNRRSIPELEKLRKELIELSSNKGVDYLTDILELVVVEIYRIRKTDDEIKIKAEIDRLAREAAQKEIDRKAEKQIAIAEESERREQRYLAEIRKKEKDHSDQLNMAKKQKKSESDRKLKAIEADNIRRDKEAHKFPTFIASLPPAHRIIQEHAAKMLKTRYDPRGLDLYIKWEQRQKK